MPNRSQKYGTSFTQNLNHQQKKRRNKPMFFIALCEGFFCWATSCTWLICGDALTDNLIALEQASNIKF